MHTVAFTVTGDEMALEDEANGHSFLYKPTANVFSCLLGCEF